MSDLRNKAGRYMLERGVKMGVPVDPSDVQDLVTGFAEQELRLGGSTARCPKCKSDLITWEWMTHGCLFNIWCSCGFSFDSNRINSLADFRQFFPVDAGAAPWKRQESCSECDGDGCAMCDARVRQLVEPISRAVCKIEAIDPDGDMGDPTFGPNWVRYADAVQQVILSYQAKSDAGEREAKVRELIEAAENIEQLNCLNEGFAWRKLRAALEALCPK